MNQFVKNNSYWLLATRRNKLGYTPLLVSNGLAVDVINSQTYFCHNNTGSLISARIATNVLLIYYARMNKSDVNTSFFCVLLDKLTKKDQCNFLNM